MKRPQRSRTAESFDPKPWVNMIDGHGRFQKNELGLKYLRLDPRPCFEPTRDPLPWLYEPTWVDPGHPEDSYQRFAQEDYESDEIGDWSPRPEYTAEVNPILVAFRKHLAETNCGRQCAAQVARYPEALAPNALPHHIEFARRVLSKLAVLS